MRKFLLRSLVTVASILALAIAGLALVLFVQSRPDPMANPEYVAMGSSFAAGPGTGSLAEGPFLCGRSSGNYAHLLAGLRGLELVDMSCSGASTRHILSETQWFQSPQMAAVDERTRLVTITIGGNDVGYIGQIVACQKNAGWSSKLLDLCNQTASEMLDKTFSALEERLTAIATGIGERAPGATIVYVAYPAVLPAAETCERLGLTKEQANRLRDMASRLLAVTRNAASRTGSIFLDAHTLGLAHNVCAEDSWIFSAADGGVAAFHPNSAGMKAIAKSLQNVLDKEI